MRADNKNIFKDQIAFLKTKPKIYEKIFENIPYFSYSYLLDIFGNPNIIELDGLKVYQDKTSKFVNIINHKRVTLNQPTNFNRTIHIFGDSVAFGAGSEDRYTIASILQNLINDNNLNIKVENYGVGDSQIMDMINYLDATKINKDDIVVFFGGGFKVPSSEFEKLDPDIVKSAYPSAIYSLINKAKKIAENKSAKFLFFLNPRIYEIENKTEIESYLNSLVYLPSKRVIDGYILARNNKIILACELCNNSGIFAHCMSVDFNKNSEELFVDNVHLSTQGSKLAAKVIFDSIFNAKPAETPDNQNILSIIEQYIDKAYKPKINEELQRYIDKLNEISKDKPNNAGVIVMNCNPFTLGHRYLIETVAKEVPWLYIMVVEEDKSTFKFSDRFEMVKLGTTDLKNVTVINSGEFVISSLTFPAYFNKDGGKDLIIDASSDIVIFATKIAPNLKCTKRFVGEEPYCNTTRQYNEQMLEILSKYNIEFIIYPRKTIDDKAISATDVRKCIEEKKYDELKKIIPTSTFDYLKKLKVIEG